MHVLVGRPGSVCHCRVAHQLYVQTGAGWMIRRISGGGKQQRRGQDGRSRAPAAWPRRHREVTLVATPANLPKPKYIYEGTQFRGVLNRLPPFRPQHASGLPLPTISRPDSYFMARGLYLMYGHKLVNVDELNRLFAMVGFPRRDPTKLQKTLLESRKVLWVQQRQPGGPGYPATATMVGFGRATREPGTAAVIWDVAVSPALQHQGLGRAVVERLTSSLLLDGVTTIQLYSEPGVTGMYEKLGFARDASGAVLHPPAPAAPQTAKPPLQPHQQAWQQRREREREMREREMRIRDQREQREQEAMQPAGAPSGGGGGSLLAPPLRPAFLKPIFSNFCS